MTDLAAAIGIEQLKKLDTFNNARIKNAQYLSEKIKEIKGIIAPITTSNSNHVFHQYTIRVTTQFPKTRDQLSEFLTKNGIGNSIFYPVPIHKQNAYAQYHQQSFPITEQLAKEALSLPIYPSLTNEELDQIISILQQISK
jgi:dTDP-4-amino-4,6-dideoxygalactose transaminase